MLLPTHVVDLRIGRHPGLVARALWLLCTGSVLILALLMIIPAALLVRAIGLLARSLR